MSILCLAVRRLTISCSKQFLSCFGLEKSMKKEDRGNTSLFSVSLISGTPIWTGDAQRRCSLIKASNILGGLRWWYEILCRSLGKNVCDPGNAKEKCELNQDRFIKGVLQGEKTIDELLTEQEICPVCRCFGCGGWSGKFRVVVGDGSKGQQVNVVLPSFEKTNDKKASKRKQRLEGMIFTAENPLSLEFYATKPLLPREIRLLRLALGMISQYGAIGGRTAQGNGVVRIRNFKDLDSKTEAVELLWSKETSSLSDYPNINNFFFLRFEVDFSQKLGEILPFSYNTLWNQYGNVPVASDIRKEIRREKGLAKWCGAVKKGPRLSSRLFVSHGYKVNESAFAIRIWGYLPDREIEQAIETIDETKVKTALQDSNVFFTRQDNNVFTVSRTVKKGSKALSAVERGMEDEA